MTTTTNPHVLVRGVNAKHLEAGDRFTYRGQQVEVLASTPEGTQHVRVAVRPTSDPCTTRELRLPKAAVADALLQADRNRVHVLDLTFWPGGASSALYEDHPLSIPLTGDGGVLLVPVYHPAGVQSVATGQVLTVPTFYEMRAVVPSLGVAGTLGTLTARARELWGDQMWCQLATLIRAAGALDGGLTAAADALVRFGDDFVDGTAPDAWLAALAAHTGTPIPPQAAPVLLSAAYQWPGTPHELVATTLAAVG